MDIHHNARSCPHSRALMVDRVEEAIPVVRVAADLGVSQSRLSTDGFPAIASNREPSGPTEH